MSTRLPPELTDPSFRLGLSTTVQKAGATGASASTAPLFDDEPTAKTMLANFGEPAQRSGLEAAEKHAETTEVQLALQNQKALQAKANKSDEKRRLDEQKLARQNLNQKLDKDKQAKQQLNLKLTAKKAQDQRLNKKLNIKSDKARLQRNRMGVLGAEVDRAKRKKLQTAAHVEATKKKVMNREQIYIQDKNRSIKTQEGNRAFAKGSVESSAIRSAANKEVHPTAVDPSAVRPAEHAPVAAVAAPPVSAVGAGAGDTGVAGGGGRNTL